MSERQWKRWDAVQRVGDQKLTTTEAAQICGLSVRHFRRLRGAVQARGQQALMHGNRGRPPANRISDQLRQQVVALRRGKYDRFSDAHFAEKLRGERIGRELSVRTVRRILRQAGIAAVRRRRPRRHRRRRDRKAQEGLMLLWDGSRHDWLEQRGPRLTLVGAIDDATGKLMPGAHFVDQECGAAYLALLKSIVSELGIPWSVYMDQHGALKRNDDHWTLGEELRGEQDPTHVGMALRALQIEVIYALSPQAKGRVERLWGTLQDRLVSELRLVKASSAKQADEVLNRYRLEHNLRFAVPAQDCTSAWRRLRSDVDLERVCSFRYEATVLKDNTVRLGGIVIDIPAGPKRRSYTDTRVEVRQLLDGSWRVYAKDQLIAVGPATNNGELRALLNRKKSRGAPVSAPRHATYVLVSNETDRIR